MWKLFLKLSSKPEMVQIRKPGTHHGASGGFSLAQEIFSFLDSDEFLKTITNSFGEDAEVQELSIKFEDIV